MSRPNIVFYFSDQQRWDTLGCYGQPLRVTPNLDALAANGTRYENAFTCQPVCQNFAGHSIALLNFRWQCPVDFFQNFF